MATSLLDGVKQKVLNKKSKHIVDCSVMAIIKLLTVWRCEEALTNTTPIKLYADNV